MSTLGEEVLLNQAAPKVESAAGARARRDLPDYLPARMLNEFTYCPRLFFYEWVEGVFAQSVDTVEGSIRHAVVDSRSDPLPQPDSEESIHSRSVNLSSDRLRLIAKIDLVEGEGGIVSPVDYKKGRPRDGAEGPEAWPADRAQICAQALVLRDNGYRCDEGVLFYGATRQRVRIVIDEGLAQATISAIADAQTLAARGRIPPPLVDSPKCPRCSLVGICLPDETLHCRTIAGVERDPQLFLFPELADGPPQPSNVDDPSGESVRRLVPARDDLRPLYVTGNGLFIGKTGEVLRIRNRDKTVQEVRVNEISQVNVFGNNQLTAAAIQGLCWAEKPVAHFSYGGWFYGFTQGLGLKNVFLRRDQFARAADPAFCVSVAREIVATKIRNHRVMLQRNHIEPPAITLRQLKHLAEGASRADDLPVLLGIEGLAARLYFEAFTGMIKTTPSDDSARERFDFNFTARNRRPPSDPVNALLSFAYSLLAKDLTIVCTSIGFDPFIGFYHQPRFGRPALALDLMEGFRPLVADSVVLNAINTRMVTTSDFVRVGPAVSLSASGRKAFLRAYEQRMDTLVTHPLFGYRVNYRRVLEIQARLLARVTTGELARYTGFETR